MKLVLPICFIGLISLFSTSCLAQHSKRIAGRIRVVQKLPDRYAVVPYRSDSLVIPYPAEAHAKDIGGIVVAHYHISQGQVDSVSIETADYPELAEGVKAGLLNKPAVIVNSGNTEPVWHRIRLFFDPNRQDQPVVVRNGEQVLR